jgi:hypothetical protein
VEKSAVDKLFAVYLGGKARGATLELHDIAFAIGPDIEATIPQLKEAWFGTAASLHIDSYVELTRVDGHEISLLREPSKEPAEKKLFFINVGSYDPKRFGESHHFYFLVCTDAPEAKRRGKALAKAKNEDQPHTDNLIELDAVTEISKVRGLHVCARKTDAPTEVQFTNLYWPLHKKS